MSAASTLDGEYLFAGLGTVAAVGLVPYQQSGQRAPALPVYDVRLSPIPQTRLFKGWGV